VAGVEDAGNGGIVSFVILITEHRIQNPHQKIIPGRTVIYSS
jgi:hypothetical protein